MYGNRYHLVAVSAETTAELDRRSRAVAAELIAGGDLAGVARRLAATDAGLPCRRFLVASDADDAVLLTSARRDVHVAQQSSGVAFLFADEPAWPSAGADLRASEPVFRRAVDEVVELAAQAAPNCAALPAFTLFALQYGIAALLVAWAVAPVAVVGDGLGSYAAACLSGKATLADVVQALSRGEPVPTADTTGAALDGHVRLLVGPAPALADREAIRTLTRPGPVPERAELLQALGRLWALGVPVDLKLVES
jgi:acyl transferase domain-containing protein